MPRRRCNSTRAERWTRDQRRRKGSKRRFTRSNRCGTNGCTMPYSDKACGAAKAVRIRVRRGGAPDQFTGATVQVGTASGTAVVVDDLGLISTASVQPGFLPAPV